MNFENFFTKETLKKWTKYTTSNFSRAIKTKSPSSMQPHGFKKVTTLKHHVFIATGPGHSFASQVGQFANKLRDLWELLLKKELGIIPFIKKSTK